MPLSPFPPSAPPEGSAARGAPGPADLPGRPRSGSASAAAAAALAAALLIFGSAAGVPPVSSEALAAVAPTPDGPEGTPKPVDDGYSALERHLQKTVKEKGIQTELPLFRPKAPPKMPDIPKPPVSLAKAAAALALGGCVALAFILVARARRAVKEKANASKAAAPVPARSRRELDTALKGVRDDADALAERGLFVEAVHALLLNGLEAFRKRDKLKVPPHMTSRELLPALPLNRTEDESLRELVFMTEGAWFGSYQLGRDHYRSARTSFGRLMGSVTPSAAASALRKDVPAGPPPDAAEPVPAGSAPAPSGGPAGSPDSRTASPGPSPDPGSPADSASETSDSASWASAGTGGAGAP